MQCSGEIKLIRAANKSHLESLVNVFGAILVGLLRRKLRLFKLQKLTPKNLKFNLKREINPCLFCFYVSQKSLPTMTLWSNYLNLLVAGGKLPLLKDQDVVSDPLQQHGDQLIILLPTQLQLLKHRHTEVQPQVDYAQYQDDHLGHFYTHLE